MRWQACSPPHFKGKRDACIQSHKRTEQGDAMACGLQQHWLANFRGWSLADIEAGRTDVRFTPKADIHQRDHDVRFVP
jgi:hypothetical protein